MDTPKEQSEKVEVILKHPVNSMMGFCVDYQRVSGVNDNLSEHFSKDVDKQQGPR
ncbi:MAG: hypothetical protein ACNYWU_04520 [Desulfobacterales bacterium]